MNFNNFSKKGKVDFTNLITLEGVSNEDIAEIILTADELKRKRAVYEYPTTLKNKYVLLVTKPNLPRSSITCQLAVKEIGGEPVISSMAGEQLENLLSDEHYVKALTSFGLSCVLVCTAKESDSNVFVKNVNVPVINATAVKSPCEALSALMTISEIYKDFKNLNVTIVGNVKDGNNSLITGLAKFGANITVLCSKNCALPEKTVDYLRQFSYVSTTEDKAVALKNADVIYFLEKDDAITITDDDLLINEKHYAVLSSLPVDPNFASLSAFKGENCYITKQTENLLHVDKAVLTLVSNKNNI